MVEIMQGFLLDTDRNTKASSSNQVMAAAEETLRFASAPAKVPTWHFFLFSQDLETFDIREIRGNKHRTICCQINCSPKAGATASRSSH
ncbi:unnamed protein product [Urochloa humidicola]